MRIRLKVPIPCVIIICGVIAIVTTMSQWLTSRHAVAEKTVSPSFHRPVSEPLRPIVIDGIFGRKRQMGMYSVLLPGGLGNSKTYKASLSSLRWLKLVQNKDGSWGSPSNSLMVTGLAALSYLYMEEMPADSPEFGETVMSALEYLVSDIGKVEQNSKLPNDLGVPIATTALSEFYRKIWNPNVKAAAEKGLKVIIAQQCLSDAIAYGSDASFSNRIAMVGWNSIALETGLKARLLTGSGMLRDASAIEKARLDSFTNIIMQIQPKWVGMTPATANSIIPPIGGLKSVEKGDEMLCHFLFLSTHRALNIGDNFWRKWFDRMWPSFVDGQFITPSEEPGTKCNCYFCSTGMFGKGLDEPYRRCDGRFAEIGHWIGHDTHADSIIADTCLAILNLTMANYKFHFNFRIDEVQLPEESAEADVEVDFGI